MTLTLDEIKTKLKLLDEQLKSAGTIDPAYDTLEELMLEVEQEEKE